MSPLDYDEVTSFLGEWGPFQLSIFILLSLSTVPNGYSGMAMVFLADTPSYRCRTSRLNGSSASLDQTGGESGRGCYQLPPLNGSSTGSSTGSSNGTGLCVDGWEYSSERYESTIVTEWDLVCGNAWKVPFSLSIFFLGVLSGSFVSGELSDRFGRKVVLFATMAIQTLSSLIQVTSVSWEMFCVFFFITGIGQISNYMAAFVLGCELLGKNLRVVYSVLGTCVFYALGYALLPLCAYLVRSWRLLLTILSLPGLLYIPLWWFIPESPRWLLAKGRVQEAEDIIRAAAKKNGITPPEVIFKTSSDFLISGSEPKSSKYTYMDLIRTPKMRHITLLNGIVWFIITITYFGLSLSTPNMNGDPYLNCLLSALMEIAAYVLAWLLLKLLPRRALITCPLLTAGLVLLLIHVVPPEYSGVSVALAMGAKLGVTAAFSVLYISAVEQFPTVVRGMGMGVCSMCSKTGSTLAPFFPYFGHYDQILPYLLMGALTVLAGLLSILMPETRGAPLPEDLSQVQTLNWCCDCCRPACSRKSRETEKTHKLPPSV
ncbi:solute carrier family 22 member 4-like isoform X2 [Salminus brasiliensis]|uniref:solute carrier family 22 member 4-like isoform X2 n=1 Tax=Salminus brasiliensis TaxID=930266 RepID=UPI003B82E4C2